MQIQLESGRPANLIRRYVAGEIVVNETAYAASLVVRPDAVIADWPPQTFAQLTEAHFELLARLHAEVVLIGTGTTLRFPPSRVLRPLIEAGVGFEIMDTGAACRTYNILMAEGRVVAAALLMIGGDDESS